MAFCKDGMHTCHIDKRGQMYVLRCVRCSFVKVMPVDPEREERCMEVGCRYNRPNAAGVVLDSRNGQPF